jgi:hypothetical protein
MQEPCFHQYDVTRLTKHVREQVMMPGTSAEQAPRSLLGAQSNTRAVISGLKANESNKLEPTEASYNEKSKCVSSLQ